MGVEHQGSAAACAGEPSDDAHAARLRFERLNREADRSERLSDKGRDLTLPWRARRERRIDGIDPHQALERVTSVCAIDLHVRFSVDAILERMSPNLTILPVRGLNLAVWEWAGEGPTFFFAHATGFHGRCWDEVIREIPSSAGVLYQWDPQSTYIQEPPF